VASTYRVLVVEDDDLSFQLVRHILGKMPLDIVNASTGAQAIEFLQQEMPDLIMLDAMMPGIGGFEVLRRLKQEEGIAVALVTHDMAFASFGVPPMGKGEPFGCAVALSSSRWPPSRRRTR